MMMMMMMLPFCAIGWYKPLKCSIALLAHFGRDSRVDGWLHRLLPRHRMWNNLKRHSVPFKHFRPPNRQGDGPLLVYGSSYMIQTKVVPGPWFTFDVISRNSSDAIQLNYTHVSRIQLYSSTSIITSYIQYMVFIRPGGSFTHVSSFTSIGEDLKFGQSFSSLFEKSATLFYTCVGIWAATVGAGSNGVLE